MENGMKLWHRTAAGGGIALILIAGLAWNVLPAQRDAQRSTSPRIANAQSPGNAIAAYLPLVGNFEALGLRKNSAQARQGSWSRLAKTDDIRKMLYDPRHETVWVATRGGLLRWPVDARRPTEETFADAKDIALEPDGVLWVADGGTSLRRRTPDGRWGTVDSDLFRSEGIQWVSIGSDLVAVAGASHLLTRKGDGPWELELDLAPSDGTRTVNGLFVDESDAVWVSIVDEFHAYEYPSLVHRRSPRGRWTVITPTIEAEWFQPPSQAASFAQAPDDGVWLLTGPGFGLLQPDGTWTTLMTHEDLTEAGIVAMADEIPWLLAYNGHRRWTSIDTEPDVFLTQDSAGRKLEARAGVATANHGVWLGIPSLGVALPHDPGKLHLPPGQQAWRPMPLESSFDIEVVQDMAVDSSGATWLDESFGSIRRLENDGRMVRFPSSSNHQVATILPDARGVTWVHAGGWPRPWRTAGEGALEPFEGFHELLETRSGNNEGWTGLQWLSLDRLERVWVGTTEGILVPQTDDTWELVSVEHGLLDTRVDYLRPLSSGGMLAVINLREEDAIDGQYDYAFHVQPIGPDGVPGASHRLQIRREGEADVGAARSVRDLAVDWDGALWMVNSDGLWFAPEVGAPLSLVEDQPREIVRYPTRLMTTEDRGLWVGYFYGVAQLPANGEWRVWTFHDGLSSGEVFWLSQGRDDSVLVGMDDGLFRVSTTGAIHGPYRGSGDGRQSAFWDYRVRSALDRPDGSTWILGENGLMTEVTPDGDPLAVFAVHDWAHARDGTQFHPRSDGAIWIATQAGIARRAAGGGPWRTWQTGDGLRAGPTTALLSTANGMAWAGHGVVGRPRQDTERAQGMSAYTPAEGWRPEEHHELDDYEIHALAGDADGQVWAGRFTRDTNGALVAQGLVRRGTDGAWTRVPDPDGRPTIEAAEIVFSRGGVGWIRPNPGSMQGVYRIGLDGRIEDEDVGFPVGGVSDMHPDTEGGVWFATTAGAFHVEDDGQVVQVFARGQLPDNDVSHVVADASGRVHFATPCCGIATYRKGPDWRTEISRPR